MLKEEALKREVIKAYMETQEKPAKIAKRLRVTPAFVYATF